MSDTRVLRLVFLPAAVVAAVGLAITGWRIARNGPAPPLSVEKKESKEAPPALQRKRAAYARYAPPDSKEEGNKVSWAEQEWLAHSIPGTDIPSESLEASRWDWSRMHGRGAWGLNRWKPLGPTWAKALPNQFRDRSVYNAATPDFSGRITHVVIDPHCGSRDKKDHHRGKGHGKGGRSESCRVWIAVGAGGGVWGTPNALDRNPDWEYLSMSFEHNSIGSLEIDPNDHRSDTLWAGTGEPNACGSGCEAGVGVYKSTDGGNRWQGPYGRDAFYNRAVGSIEVKPGQPNVIFAASGRAIRGLTSSCCSGVDALIPGAPHFGLWRSTDGGHNWELVNQGATELCTASTPDQVSLNGTACSPRGARRVQIDPVDPNTVYATFFARGIWRSRQNGDPGTWEQIFPRIGPASGTAERAEFDVVRLPNGETRMYVGVGGGGVVAHFRRNDDVRSAPAAAVLASWTLLTSTVQDTPGYSSFGYCDGQCSYDNYVFAPATHAPRSGADHDTVYLLGDNEYNENNWGPLSPRFQGSGLGRSSGRGIAVSTNGGVHFTDMTDDASDDFYPVELHPDHHALVVNPRNWKQFFAVGDGGIVRSNGVFVNDSADCVQPKGYTGTRLAFCELVLSRVPERLEPINKGLRTLHFYQIDVSPFHPTTVVGGTQDNGSWERGDTEGSGTNPYPGLVPEPPVLSEFPRISECLGRGRGDDDDDDDNGNHRKYREHGEDVWVNTNIADGGHNAFDRGDPCFRMTSFQSGQMMVHYEPKNQLDANWIADTQFVFYGGEANAFVGVANADPVRAHWLWSAREHVFRSTNQGRNPTLTKETHRLHCNIWYGDADVDGDGTYVPELDLCDDWKPLGDPSSNGRLTSAAYGADRMGGYVAVIERGHDGGTLWAGTQMGRVLVSKNAHDPSPEAVVFDRIDNDPTAANTPPRFVSAIYVDPKDSNHAWIAYSGYSTKTPATPGHVFEVRYNPNGPDSSTFVMLDGNQPKDRLGDIPATSIVVGPSGRVYVGTDYGCVATMGNGVWRPCGGGLPRMPVSDLMYVRAKRKLYAATHGQGVWELRVHDIERH